MTKGAASTTPPISATFRVEREGFARPGRDEVGAGRQDPQRGRENEIRNAVHEEERDEHSHAERETGTNEPLPQFVEMLEEPHSPFIAVIGRIRGEPILRLGHSAEFYAPNPPAAPESDGHRPTRSFPPPRARSAKASRSIRSSAVRVIIVSCCSDP